MLLNSVQDRRTFELRLLRYEFPDIENDDWDSNWLQVSMRMDSPEYSWQRSHPCLVTMEVHHLVNWLGNHALCRNEKPRIFFTEPNLSLEVEGSSSDSIRLRIYFAMEFLPPGVTIDYDSEDAEEFSILMNVTCEDLRKAANELCRELQKFPVRANARMWSPECKEI